MKRKKGIMLSEVAFRNIPILLKNCGMDFFIIDTEHGGFDYSDLSGILMTAKLCGLESIVRLPDNGRREITRIMDMGATGILIPITNDESQIKKAVEYAKYAPVGKRGISTMRPHTFYRPGPLEEYMKEANEATKVFAQIETAAGVDNAEKILSAEGVSGFMLGPNDLSCDLGCVKDAENRILPLISELSRKAAALGKSSGIITSNQAYLDEAKSAGTEYFSVGSELNILKDGILAVAERINRGETIL